MSYDYPSPADSYAASPYPSSAYASTPYADTSYPGPAALRRPLTVPALTVVAGAQTVYALFNVAVLIIAVIGIAGTYGDEPELRAEAMGRAFGLICGGVFGLLYCIWLLVDAYRFGRNGSHRTIVGFTVGQGVLVAVQIVQLVAGLTGSGVGAVLTGLGGVACGGAAIVLAWLPVTQSWASSVSGRAGRGGRGGRRGGRHAQRNEPRYAGGHASRRESAEFEAPYEPAQYGGTPTPAGQYGVAQSEPSPFARRQAPQYREARDPEPYGRARSDQGSYGRGRRAQEQPARGRYGQEQDAQEGYDQGREGQDRYARQDDARQSGAPQQPAQPTPAWEAPTAAMRRPQAASAAAAAEARPVPNASWPA